MGAGTALLDGAKKVVLLGRSGDVKVPVGYVADRQGLQVFLKGDVLV